jgi:hypothetical protein
MTRYECDCGLVYSHPDQLIACGNNRHGLGKDAQFCIWELLRYRQALERIAHNDGKDVRRIALWALGRSVDKERIDHPDLWGAD